MEVAVPFPNLPSGWKFTYNTSYKKYVFWQTSHTGRFRFEHPVTHRHYSRDGIADSLTGSDDQLEGLSDLQSNGSGDEVHHFHNGTVPGLMTTAEDHVDRILASANKALARLSTSTLDRILATLDRSVVRGGTDSDKIREVQAAFTALAHKLRRSAAPAKGGSRLQNAAQNELAALCLAHRLDAQGSKEHLTAALKSCALHVSSSDPLIRRHTTPGLESTIKMRPAVVVPYNLPEGTFGPDGQDSFKPKLQRAASMDMAATPAIPMTSSMPTTGTGLAEIDHNSPVKPTRRSSPPKSNGKSLPFPALPSGWRHNISKSNKYYFWQKGTKNTTYQHPVTGKQYRVPEEVSELMSSPEKAVPAPNSTANTNGTTLNKNSDESATPSAFVGPNMNRRHTTGTAHLGSPIRSPSAPHSNPASGSLHHQAPRARSFAENNKPSIFVVTDDANPNYQPKLIATPGSGGGRLINNFVSAAAAMDSARSPTTATPSRPMESPPITGVSVPAVPAVLPSANGGDSNGVKHSSRAATPQLQLPNHTNNNGEPNSGESAFKVPSSLVHNGGAADQRNANNSNKLPPRTRDVIAQLNDDFAKQKIGSDEYHERWANMMNNHGSGGAAKAAAESSEPAMPEKPVSTKPIVASESSNKIHSNSGSNSVAKPRTAAASAPAAAAPQPQPVNNRMRGASPAITTAIPVQVPPVIPAVCGAQPHSQQQYAARPQAAQPQQPQSHQQQLPVPLCQDPDRNCTPAAPYTPGYVDPAPYLSEGCTDAPPGPRVNPNPPPPPMPGQFAQPHRPRLMTFLAPALLNGTHLSPPDGEMATKHTFDFATRTWKRTQIKVRIDRYPFQEGTLRSVFHMKDLSQPAGPRQNYVAKMSKDPMEPVSAYFNACEMQALASHFADEYNKLNPPKKIAFLEASVIECHMRRSPTSPKVVFAIEPYVHGTFIKYTNNYGWINPGLPRSTPQAFTHFTYFMSQATMLVVDVQGITDEANVDWYTDPQIHTLPRAHAVGFGKADLRADGILKFFQSHQCNDVCEAMNLPPRFRNPLKFGIHSAAAGPVPAHLPPPNPNLARNLCMNR